MTSRDCFVQMLFTVKVILCNVCNVTTASNGIMYIWHYSGLIFIIYIILYVVTMCMFSEVSSRD